MTVAQCTSYTSWRHLTISITFQLQKSMVNVKMRNIQFLRLSQLKGSCCVYQSCFLFPTTCIQTGIWQREVLGIVASHRNTFTRDIPSWYKYTILLIVVNDDTLLIKCYVGISSKYADHLLPWPYEFIINTINYSTIRRYITSVFAESVGKWTENL